MAAIKLSSALSITTFALALAVGGGAGCAPPLSETEGAYVPCTGAVRTSSTCYEPERSGSGGSASTAGVIRSTRAEHHQVPTTSHSVRVAVAPRIASPPPTPRPQGPPHR